jgi:hypothetical protein
MRVLCEENARVEATHCLEITSFQAARVTRVEEVGLTSGLRDVRRHLQTEPSTLGSTWCRRVHASTGAIGTRPWAHCTTRATACGRTVEEPHHAISNPGTRRRHISCCRRLDVHRTSAGQQWYTVLSDGRSSPRWQKTPRWTRMRFTSSLCVNDSGEDCSCSIAPHDGSCTRGVTARRCVYITLGVPPKARAVLVMRLNSRTKLSAVPSRAS